jgi:hypothetical protein
MAPRTLARLLNRFPTNAHKASIGLTAEAASSSGTRALLRAPAQMAQALKTEGLI